MIQNIQNQNKMIYQYIGLIKFILKRKVIYTKYGEIKFIGKYRLSPVSNSRRLTAAKTLRRSTGLASAPFEAIDEVATAHLAPRVRFAKRRLAAER